jgi:iron complex outermembrane recepter protein
LNGWVMRTTIGMTTNKCEGDTAVHKRFNRLMDKTLLLGLPRGGSTLTLSAALLALITAGLPTLVDAQVASTDTSAGASSDGLAEIVVTARRRSENVENVPATITVVSGAELRDRGIDTEADLQQSVPGLLVRDSTSNNQLNYSIRGESIDAYSSSSPGVLAYYNEVQTEGGSQSTFYDMASVQVLKGPQGTLFGRNTTGGAVLFTTNRPTDDYSADILARIGDYRDKEVQLDVNIPIIPDKVLLRIAGAVVDRNGYVNNIFPGDSGRLGDTKDNSGRVTLLVMPTEALENLTMFQYTSTGGTNLGGPVYSVQPCSTGGTQAACIYSPTSVYGSAAWTAFLAAHPGVYPGGLSAFGAVQQARGPYVVDFNSPSDHFGHNPLATNTTTYTFSPDLLVKNILGYSNAFTRDSTDVDGTPYPVYIYGSEKVPDNTKITTQQGSEELQVQGKAFDHTLTYIVGSYGSYEAKSYYIPQGFFFFSPDIAPSPLLTDDNKDIDRSEAAFFQGTYDLVPLTHIEGLNVTGGFRYTWEQNTLEQAPLSTFYGAPSLNARFSDPSWLFSLDYQVTKELLLYVTQRGSWRSGGFNANARPQAGFISTGGTEFLPETTTDVEIGAKFDGELAGLPFRVNVDAFNQWVKNAQKVFYFELPLYGPTAVTTNVPEAEVTGMEADVQIKPTRWLTMGFNVTYQDARYTENRVVAFGQTVNFGPYADAPRWQGSVFASANLPIVPESAGQLTVRGNLYAQSLFFFSNLNNTVNPGTQLPSYTTANFRLDWANIEGSNYGAALYITNAFNRVYYTGGLPVGYVLGENTAIPGPPRMFGVELRAKF